MPAVTFHEEFSLMMSELTELGRLESEKRTYLVFSFKKNEFNKEFYKRDFILHPDTEMLSMIIQDNCMDDDYLQIRLKYNMNIHFEYTAETTLGEEIEECLDEFERHLAIVFRNSPEMSEEEIESHSP